MDTLLDVIIILCQVLMAAIFTRVILSWLSTRPGNPLVTIIDAITEPILGPLRRIIPSAGTFDFSPLVAMMLLYVIIIVVDQVSS